MSLIGGLIKEREMPGSVRKADIRDMALEALALAQLPS